MAANLESSHREDVLPYHSKSPGLPYDNPSYDDRRWESSAHRRSEDRPTLESRRMTSHGSGGGGGGGNYGAGGGGRGSISSREVVMEMEDIVEPEEERPFIRRDVASPSQPSSASESRRSQWSSDVYWLALYFAFNLGLTLFNKIVLVSFPFPYTLTGLHALSGCIGCYIALENGSFVPAHLTSRDNLILAAFSVLYTINIAVSNLSLQLVTIPFHQVVRASSPLFIIILSVILLRKSFSGKKILTLLPVIAGVGLATYGDYHFTTWGLILTLFGTLLAALKTIATNVMQTGGLRLHPLDLLMRMSPLAFIQCVSYAWWSGELERVRAYGAREMTRTKALALFVNGVIAFGLNYVSFTANKKTGALTMTVAANVKQVLTIVLAVIIFNLSISPTNGLGILLTLAGGAAYAYVEYQDKQHKQLGQFKRRQST